MLTEAAIPDDLEHLHAQNMAELFKACAELEDCDEGRANRIFAVISEASRQTPELEQALYKGLHARIHAGKGLPVLAALHVNSAIAARAAGEADWNKCFRSTPEEIDRQEKLKQKLSLIDAVEAQRKVGHATSNNGDPGPAFEHAAQSLKGKRGNPLSASTVRDAYYKAMGNEDVAQWNEIGNGLRETEEGHALLRSVLGKDS